MSVIYNIAGTTSDTFSLNGKLTLFQGDNEPETYQGVNGDVYYQSNGNVWSKFDDTWHNTSSLSLPQPSENTGKMIYSNGVNFVPTTFDYSDVALKGEASFTKGAEIFASQPYIDFHYNNSTGDYTSRIIEASNGVLSISSANNAQTSASNSTTSTAIATQGWVNDPTKSTNVVHRTGDETIAGTKTFSSTINGTALKTYWGDIAEYNDGDADYEYGTLVQVGGTNEFTIATTEVNAVVANVDTAAFIMNGSNTFEHPLPIVLKGRVLVKVERPVNKFDKLYLSKEYAGIASNVPNGEHFGIAMADDHNGYVLANVSARF